MVSCTSATFCFQTSWRQLKKMYPTVPWQCRRLPTWLCRAEGKSNDLSGLKLDRFHSQKPRWPVKFALDGGTQHPLRHQYLSQNDLVSRVYEPVLHINFQQSEIHMSRPVAWPQLWGPGQWEPLLLYNQPRIKVLWPQTEMQSLPFFCTAGRHMFPQQHVAFDNIRSPTPSDKRRLLLFVYDTPSQTTPARSFND